ncbi:MAG: alpha/beta hydrolase [Chitinophagaceae bacterium]|jgi:acetyl esterase/lipase|nr:alpha/beta hydrolase [Chitinophagaceae bacterium]
MQENMNYSKVGIDFIYEKSVSFLSNLLQFFMYVVNFKNRIHKIFSTRKFLTKPAKFPKGFSKNLHISSLKIAERNLYIINRKESKSPKVIFYIHGGAYISNIISQHWDLIKILAEHTSATFIVPDYPLAPFSTFTETYKMVEKAYKRILTTTAPQNIIFMGDSAGAGLALGLAQKLQKENSPQPEQIILLSPWLDITMANPDILSIEKQDNMLSKSGLIKAGQAYAGSSEPTNYLLSPIYGDFKGLGKISLFIGTNDLFICDSRKFKRMMNEQNISFNYFEYPRMFHVFMAVTMLKEAKDAIKHIINLILSSPNEN